MQDSGGSGRRRPARPGPTAFLALLLPAIAWMSGARVIYAQSTPAETRYTFAFVGIPLANALDRLIAETQLSLVFESDAVADKTTFCRAEHVTAEPLLRCVLQGTGLDYVRLSSGTYVLVPDPHTAPRHGSLTGQVVDAATGMPLADANVLLAEEGIGTATTRDGRFAFVALRPGPHRLVVTHVAYEDAADSVWVQPEANDRIAVAMEPRVVLSEPVVVSGFEMRLPSESLGSGRRTADERMTPAGAGTPDVVRDLDAVVGVRLGDALSDVHVQGGAANEQQFLLDGAPVFVPVSNGGFIGPFSPFAAGQVTVRKAGFGAAHGSGLSGVIEVEQRLAQGGGPSLTAQVDPLSFNALWRGSAGSAGSLDAVWMVAARKGLWELYAPQRLERLFRRWGTPDRFLIQALQTPEENPVRTPAAEPAAGTLEVDFFDLHAAARVRFGGLRSLRFSFYQGSSAFGIDNVPAPDPGGAGSLEDSYRWTNQTGQVHYEWVQSRRLFASASAWFSGYLLSHPNGTKTAPASPADDFNEINEAGLRLQGELAASARHMLSGAVEATHIDSDFSLSVDPFGAAPAGAADIRPLQWRFAAFLEDRLALSHRATLTLGTRLTYLPLKQNVYAEPRLAFQYDHPAGDRGSWAFRAAVGHYRQYLHSFDVATYNVTSLLPLVRFWLPVGRDQRLPEAYHATVAVLYRPAPAWEFGVETYYKHQPHLLVPDYGSRPDGETPGEVLTDADGYAYGGALTARRTGRRLQLSAQYEYAVARRRVPNRFGGAFVTVPWSAPHRLFLALDLVVVPRLTATVRWQGVCGRSWGFRQAYYDYLEPDPQTRRFPPFDLSDPAAHRLPVFSQWDAGLAYAGTVGGAGFQARLSFINLLGRRNVTDWSLRYDEQAAAYTRQPRYAVPFLPSFSLQLSR